MTRDELRCILALIDLVLHQSETQSSVAKLLLKRFEKIEAIQVMRVDLARLTDLEARKALRSKLQALENEAKEESNELCLYLENVIARGESASEQVEAIATKLRKELGEQDGKSGN